MGQRMQVFIHMPNPIYKVIKEYKSGKKHNASQDDLKKIEYQIQKFKIGFGMSKNINLVYHNQWLYGRSSLLSGANILHYISNATNNSNPFNGNGEYSGDEQINLITHILSAFTCKLAKKISRYGIERFHLLNFKEPYMRERLDAGDNNDGVLVINTVENSYCFANIGGDSTINQLPLLHPVNAVTYVRLYYPECAEDSATVDLPSDLEERRKIFTDNKRFNSLFTKAYEPYSLLSKSELSKMFPGTLFNE